MNADLLHPFQPLLNQKLCSLACFTTELDRSGFCLGEGVGTVGLKEKKQQKQKQKLKNN